MAVSPRETMFVMREYCWRGLVCASLLLAAGICAAALAQEPRFFRIGTAATGGSFFEIGGIVAGVLAYLSTVLLMRYFKRQEVNALLPFAGYCVLLGAVALVFGH